MPTASTVVATTPFLTVDQVAAELGIAPLGVRRLIALKLLPANRMVAETGEWKITPAALEQYAASNRKRMLMPPLNAGWFDDGQLSLIKGNFEHAIRSLMYSLTPDVCPVESTPGQQTSESIQLTAATSDIVRLGREPLKQPLRREARSPETVIPNYGTAFLVAELARRTFNAVRKGKLPGQSNPDGDVVALFDSPESYRRFVDAGWKNFVEFNTKFSVTRQYPNGVMISFVVPHTVLTNAIGLSTVEPLTF